VRSGTFGGQLFLLLKGLFLKLAYFCLVLLVVIAAMFLVFQVYLVSCPGFTAAQCWVAHYVPPPPAKEPANETVVLKMIQGVKGSYGFGQPIWVKVLDYYHLMLTSNYGYNVGNTPPLQFPFYVSTTVSDRLPYTFILALSSALAVLAIGVALRMVSRGARNKRLTPPPIGAFLLMNAALAGVFVWGMHAAIPPGESNWVNAFLGRAVPSWYYPFAQATLLKSGLAYDVAYLEAVSVPFVALTLVGVLSLALVRLANRGPVHYMTAFSASLVSVLCWSLVVEPITEWPGLGQAFYLSEVIIDLPLEQAAVFEAALAALLTIFVVYVARDVAGLALKSLGWRREAGLATVDAKSTFA
jgi:ABC-type dipeptide/oligopeptide/nickel transport system permease component